MSVFSSLKNTSRRHSLIQIQQINRHRNTAVIVCVHFSSSVLCSDTLNWNTEADEFMSSEWFSITEVNKGDSENRSHDLIQQWKTTAAEVMLWGFSRFLTFQFCFHAWLQSLPIIQWMEKCRNNENRKTQQLAIYSRFIDHELNPSGLVSWNCGKLAESDSFPNRTFSWIFWQYKNPDNLTKIAFVYLLLLINICRSRNMPYLTKP